MTRIVIMRNLIPLYAYVIIMAVTFMIALYCALFIVGELWYKIIIMFFPLAVIIRTLYWMPPPSFKKEVIIVDDSGLTINGNVKLGSVPWDFIINAEIETGYFLQTLVVYLTDREKLKSILGEHVIEKVEKDRKGQWISADIRYCKLHGISLEAIINERAVGVRRNAP